MTTSGRGTSRVIGFVAGLALAAVAVLAWRVPAGAGRLGADLRVSAAPTGELEVSPVGVFLTGTNLEPAPGKEAGVEGRLNVKNQTGTTLAVRPQALPSTVDLDQVVNLNVAADGEVVFEGPLGDLRAKTDRSLRLGAGQAATLVVRAWVRGDAGDSYRGRTADVPLHLHTEPAGA